MLYILNRQALISLVLFLSKNFWLFIDTFWCWYLLLLWLTRYLCICFSCILAFPCFFPLLGYFFFIIINTDIWFMYCFRMYIFMYTHWFVFSLTPQIMLSQQHQIYCQPVFIVLHLQAMNHMFLHEFVVFRTIWKSGSVWYLYIFQFVGFAEVISTCRSDLAAISNGFGPIQCSEQPRV